MPKRTLTVQNKGNEHEQRQSSSAVTRLSSKRVNTNESLPTKKPKIDETLIDKENIPKRQTRQSTKPKEPTPRPPSPPVTIIEPVAVSEVTNLPEDTDEESESEEEEILVPSTTNDDDASDHPTNKQYVIYENVGGPTTEPFIISKTARFWNRKYRKVLRHVNPDAYGMYIHADFSCYGELEVVENCLFDLTKAIFIVQQGILARFNYTRKPADKVNYILAFRRLEALTILLDFTDGISGIDDGDRFGEIMRVIGACYVTILRGLLPHVMFKKIEKSDENLVKKLNKISKQIPNFKQVLERAIVIGHIFVTIGDVCSAYTKVLQMVYCNWVFVMEKITIDLNEKPDKAKQDLWNAMKHAVGIDENGIEDIGKESFDFMKQLRLYKEQYGLGGDSYDLSKWSRADRADYSYGRSNPFGSFWF